MIGICNADHFDITPFNNKNNQNQPLNHPEINMTPTKYKQKDYDYANNEMGSPVLDSTALSNLQSKSFLSSTPVFNRAEPATPETKKSVLNILDQLCSPISGENNEKWQFKSSTKEINKELTPASSSKKSAVTKISKPFSTDFNKLKSNSCLNESSQESVKGNLNVTHDLFDDISDISLQFLCEATSHVVGNPKLNENTSTHINNNSDREVLNEENIHFCGNKEKDEETVIYLNCNDERAELMGTAIFDNKKLIYSNTNFRSDAPSSIHLNDLFSEVKCLEEANRTFKKALKPRDLQVALNDNQNKSSTFLNLSNKKESNFQSSKNLDPVKSELETKKNFLNCSLGISDTQFCEAVEAAELISNLNTNFNSNINSTGNIAQRINFYDIEKIHKKPRGGIESCINNLKSEIPLIHYPGPRGKSVKLPQDILAKGISLPSDSDSSEPEPVLKGFQTESGKLVKVSSNFLDKTKHLDHDSSYEQKLIPKCVQTASGISEKFLKEVKSEPLLKDSHTVPGKLLIKSKTLHEDLSYESDRILEGFHIPSGKFVTKSKELGELTKMKCSLSHSLGLSVKGFQTASGKLVKISEKSLEKARQLLDDGVDLKQQDFQTGNGKLVKVSEETLEQSNQLFYNEPNSIQKCFQTASTKSINISENSLKNTKQLFGEGPILTQNGSQTVNRISVNVSEESLEQTKQLFDNQPNLIPKGFQTASGKSVKILEDSLEKAKQLFNDGPNILQKGFQTANGKSVKISEDSLVKAKQLFDDGLSILQKGFQTANGKSVKVPKEKQAKQLFDGGPNLLQKGFQTASGKSVKISEDSLVKAKQLFDDGPNLLQKGFQTASGKSVKISEDSLVKAKQLFDDGPNLLQKGFQTASGKSVKISEDSLVKAKQLFDDGPNLLQKGFQTASGKSVKISEDSLVKAKQLFDDGPNLLQKSFQTANGKSLKVLKESSEQPMPLFDGGSNLLHKGFQTASGKSVQISEDSLEKAKQLFDDHPHLKQKGFQTASGKSVKVSVESLEQAKSLFDDDLNSIQQSFLTASGKSVKESEKSLGSAKHLFDDGPNLIHNNNHPENEISIEISKGSLRKVKNSINNIGPKSELALKRFQSLCENPYILSVELLKNTINLLDEVVFEPSPIKKDFRTASGKSVKLSEDSTKAQHFMKNVSSETDILLRGYQSVCGNPVGVAEKCLGNICYDDSHDPNSIKGFSTASGKSVQISEESLKKAKGLFDNTTGESRLDVGLKISKSTKDSNQISKKLLSTKEHLLSESYVTEPVLKGFQTIGRKCVDMSGNFMKKAIDTLDDASPKPQSEHVFKAFQTASGKGVNLSEESLKKAKNLFKDDHNETGDNLIRFKNTRRKSVECNDSQKGTVFTIGKSCPKIDTPFTISSSRVSLQGMQEDNVPLHNNISGVENVLQAEKLVFHLEVEKRKRKHPNQSDRSSQMDKTLNNLSLKDPFLYENKKSYNSLRKRRKLFIETDTTDQINENKLVYNEEDLIIGASVISEADLSLLNQSRNSLSGNENQINEHSPDTMSPSVAREVSESMAALLADEATNSPFSLKPCVSSPGMLFDRHARLPPIDCYDDEVHINNNQLSPILGSRCSFSQRKYNKHQTGSVSTPITLINKTANENTKSSGFKPPYATSTPNETQLRSKRKSIYSNLYAQTEKRQKIDLNSENETVYDVSKARLEAAWKQEQYIKEKLKNREEIKPCKGSYLLRKQTEKSRSLCDLTANGPLSLLTIQELNQCGVKESVREISIRNVMEFKFVAVHCFSKETACSNVNGIPIGDGAILTLDGEAKAGVKEITRAFLASPSIDPTLVSSEWVENHFKWIVLKMAAMERMFPREFGNRYLTPNNLMLQLKYRYDREIDRSQRSALRKILEKDESPAKTMVLFVADILDAEVQPDKEKHVGRKDLELSDGWYSIRATIDHEMELLLRSKKVAVGTKLVISGAELNGNEAGCHPLETPANVRLRLSTNSTRRARWFARLGFHARRPRPARLREVLGRGGTLPALTAAVARTYPILFLEKVDGRTVVRSERAEQTVADEYQTKRQQCAEAVLSQLQRDLESSRSSKKHPVTRTLVQHATSTKHLYSLLDGVDDIGFLQDVLSKEQLNEIQQLKEDEMRKVQQQLQDRLVDQLDKKVAPRKVTRMLKVRLVDDDEQTNRSALLTAWNPPDDVMSCLAEGNVLTFYNISASGFSRFGDLQLTAGKQTKYSLQKHRSSPRGVTSLSELQNSEFKPRFSEVDVVGLVVQPTDLTPDKTSSLVYFADCNHNFIGVSFWTDLKATGYANCLTPGSLVAASNLHWRSHLVSWRLPSAYATEMSTFSQHPRQPHLQEALAQLRNRVQSMDLAIYLESCQDRIKSHVAQRNCGGVQQESTSVGGSGALNATGPTGSGVSCGNSNQKLARDKVDSSVTENVDTPANRRLEMLERYGEPPPISPLPTSTPTSVKRSFRPPVRKFSEKR